MYKLKHLGCMPRPAASYETSAFSALVCGPKAASGAPADKSKKPWLPAPPKAFVHAELQAVETKLDAEARQWRGDGTLSHAGSAKTRSAFGCVRARAAHAKRHIRPFSGRRRRRRPAHRRERAHV